MAWSVCSDAERAPEDGPHAGQTAAYGKWIMKWNDTAAARLRKSYRAEELVKPGYDPSIARRTTLR